MASVTLPCGYTPFSSSSRRLSSLSLQCPNVRRQTRSSDLHSQLAFVPRRRCYRHGAQIHCKVSATQTSVTEEPACRLQPFHPRRRIALFIEPSPFSHISGYKNRFLNFIKYLREMGDEVLVVTTHIGAPDEFYGAKVIASWRYIPKYTFSCLVRPMWWVIKLLHMAADLTLVTSSAVGRELQIAGAAAACKIRLWSKGVDSDSFNPCFKSNTMRARLTAGETDRPLIIHVGRLGIEKNLGFLAKAMERIPDARLAFIGDGPCRQELQKLFEGKPVVFTGMLLGEDLSKAYASGDVFVTPSELETLGFVVLEAMASGVPVVAARAGGIPDIISPSQEGRTGFLFTPGDVDDCVSKIKALLGSKDLRRRIGAAARAEAEKHDWRSATKCVRNEEYDRAMQFWQKRSSSFLHSLARFFSYLHNFISSSVCSMLIDINFPGLKEQH